MTVGTNKYGKIQNLRNESDVEQNFIVKLLEDIGYTEDYRKTKTVLQPAQIDKGKRKRSYVPDYICYIDIGHRIPILIVDAKSPSENAVDGVTDAQLYASVIRRTLSKPKPDQFCLGSNGHTTVVRAYDSDTGFPAMSFEEFQDGNAKFEELKDKFSRAVLRKAHQTRSSQEEQWKPQRPSIEEIKGVFQKCHNRIWKRESLLPTAAFYEFTKLIFLKMREDERLHVIMDRDEPVRKKDLRFHTEWIDNNSEVSPNPVNRFCSDA